MKYKVKVVDRIKNKKYYLERDFSGPYGLYGWLRDHYQQFGDGGIISVKWDKELGDHGGFIALGRNWSLPWGEWYAYPVTWTLEEKLAKAPE